MSDLDYSPQKFQVKWNISQRCIIFIVGYAVAKKAKVTLSEITLHKGTTKPMQKKQTFGKQ